MGQKTHPSGLRIGNYRKWSSSWVNINSLDSKKLFFSEYSLSKFFSSFFSNYFYSPKVQSKRAFLVDLKLYKIGRRTFSAFVVFYKMRSQTSSK